MKLKLIWVLLLLCNLSYSQVEQEYVRRGNREYEDEKYKDAEILYRRALEKNPESERANYNLGNTMYRQDQYEAAAARYDGLLKDSKDPVKRSRYYYNLGNTWFRTGKYKESIDAYKNALLNNPDDMDAKHNLQMALRMQQQNQQQQNQQQQNQQQNQQSQDQQQNRNQQENQQQNQQNQEQQQDQRNNNQSGQEQADQNNPEMQPERGQISPEDAERLLKALENDEKNVMKKVQEQQERERMRQVPVEKNW